MNVFPIGAWKFSASFGMILTHGTFVSIFKKRQGAKFNTKSSTSF
jgi:hypothetical protein